MTDAAAGVHRGSRERGGVAGGGAGAAATGDAGDRAAGHRFLGANRGGCVAFKKGLGEVGFAAGQNIFIEYRYGQNDIPRWPELPADLVRRRVAVFATLDGPAPVRAATTTTTPIVFEAGGDLCRPGSWPASILNRPGGNATGIAILNRIGAQVPRALARTAPEGHAICGACQSFDGSRHTALRPAHSRCHQFVTRLTKGFSHFVASMTAPVASRGSGRRVGLTPTGKRRLRAAHAMSGHRGLFLAVTCGHAHRSRPGGN
jgi:hypothetical protein